MFRRLDPTFDTQDRDRAVFGELLKAEDAFVEARKGEASHSAAPQIIGWPVVDAAVSRVPPSSVRLQSAAAHAIAAGGGRWPRA